MAKRLRSDPPSPNAFAFLIHVKPKVLTVKYANKQRAREEDHHHWMENASTDDSSIKNEVTQLKALPFNRECEGAAPQIDQVALIMSAIQGILSLGVMVVLSMLFPYLPPGFLSQ